MMNQLLKKKNELTKKKKGFTLVELIIVIAVIAVLAAIAIPKFGKIKQDANKRTDQANAKIIATAVSTAVANGESISPGVISNNSDYVKYIDGGKAPVVKSKDKTGFYVSYTEDSKGTNGTVIKGDGVVVRYDSATGDILYPALN